MLVHGIEKAGTRDKEAVADAIGKVALPAGHPDLFFPLTGGLSFTEDRMIKDLRSLMVQWSPPPKLETNVVFPKIYASAPPRR